MKHSTDRILTTHAGRLDGRNWQEMARSGDAGDRAALQSRMVKVIREQAGAGIDVVSDGELGKVGFGLPYYGRRLAGLTSRTVSPDDPGWMSLRTGERIEFADFYKTLNWPTPTERVVCTGPVSYIGNEEVKKDTALFKAALSEAAVKVEEAFMCVLAPGWLEHFFHNEHYRNDEEFLFALADAMKHEYKAIVDAGFILQLDDPGLPGAWDMLDPQPSVEEYRRYASQRVEILNHALEGIPVDRVRYHICWGSWHGPHTTDFPLRDIVDVMLRVNAQAYLIEAGNVRHEHEYKVWRDVKLPAGKILIPGVVSHATDLVEHPELVADRILTFAEIVGRENVIAGTDCGLGGRVHPQIAWAKLRSLRDGAAIASKKLWS
jgi:5-methyltetrahydropteroyltriglutamate--homocysteine methyltransferase